MNKKLFLIKIALIGLFVSALGLTGCQKDETPMAEVSVNKDEIVLADNKLVTVDIEVTSNIPWTATIVDDQNQTPLWFYIIDESAAAGVNTLTIAIKEANPSYDNSRKGYVIITIADKIIKIPVIQPVKTQVIDVDKVTISGEAEYVVRRSIVLQLTAVVIPENATNKTVIWSTDNAKVATVDEDGKVKTLAYGLAKITAKSIDGNKTASVAINVVQYMPGDYYPDLNVTFSAPGVVASGTMPIGVVVFTSNYGRSGKIVSLDEGFYAWGPNDIVASTDGSISTSGEINTLRVKTEQNINNFPAFKWCVEKTTGDKFWFFPAIDEINSLFDLYNINRPAFNAKFVQAGGRAYDTQGAWYYSSTEVASDVNWKHIFWMVSWGDRYNGHGTKLTSGSIRAFAKF